MAIPVVQLLNDEAEAIDRAAEALDAGRLVVVPTETVYGAAARLDRPEAIRRLRLLRAGASGPLVPHVADANALSSLVGPTSDLARRMTHKLWPGPVALAFDVPADRRAGLAQQFDLNETDLFSDGSITIRCPDHPATIELIRRAGVPLAIVRVETRGGDRPFDEKTLDALPTDDIALVLDGGRTRFAKPSTLVKIEGDQYRVVREGVFDARIIARQLKTTILFVCSGNTCRSPMASAIATRQLKDALLPGEGATLESVGIEVLSAGTFAMPGLRATPQAVEAVAELGADLSSHRSRQLSPELIHAADFIIAMGRSHTQAILAQVPSAAGKLMMLDPAGDVEDPIGGDLTLYRSVAAKFETLVADRLSETVLAAHAPAERAQR